VRCAGWASGVGLGAGRSHGGARQDGPVRAFLEAVATRISGTEDDPLTVLAGGENRELAARALTVRASLAADATITDVEVSDVAVGAAGETAPADAVLAAREVA
jgi:hypothetical protein